MLLAGCGGSSEVAKHPIQGSVTFEGQPVTVGSVNFYSPETGSAAAATLDASGQFELNEGLPAGTYKVSVQPPIQEVAAGAPEPETVQEYPQIPEKYRSDTTSGLSATVGTEGNRFEFQLSP